MKSVSDEGIELRTDAERLTRRRRSVVACVGGAVALGALAMPAEAHAFCGFYVSGADAKLFNNATQVVLMRGGTRTVLSMANNYQGPPENFAMVVPVPVVLQKENVKTLTKEIFERVDTLAAPRLVEYWEQDPCPVEQDEGLFDMEAKAAGAAPAPEAVAAASHGVKVEAQFTVGEYEIVILSAKDSMGLDTWLREMQYKIPAGAEPLLKPYVQAGLKFFVAKVDVKKVRFDKGMAMLSPLRFHYDSETFNLPVRLGLVNSQGAQDLIVHVLARGQRYEVANYPNVTIPTNIDVAEAARDQFGAFYAALFDRTLQKKPGAVITEYAWDAGTCDPCPGEPLNEGELATLGADVLPNSAPPQDPRMGGGWGGYGGGFVLTRLHARYDKSALGEDLVFKAAPPIEGGREVSSGSRVLEEGSKVGQINNFQGRYAIRHAWAGAIECDNPQRGIWGGPPEGVAQRQPKAALNVAFAPRNLPLEGFLAEDVPALGAKAGGSPPAVWNAPSSGGCGACFVAPGRDPVELGMVIGGLVVGGLLGLRLRTRRRQDNKEREG